MDPADFLSGTESPSSQHSDLLSQESVWAIEQLSTFGATMEYADEAAEHFYGKWLKEGNVDDLDDAVIYCRQCIDLSEETDADRARMESRLVVCLTEQYLAIHDKETLSSALSLAKRLYDDSKSQNDTLLSKRANNYAKLLGHRFDAERQFDDLDKSVEIAEDGVAADSQAVTILHSEKGVKVKDPGAAIYILNTLAGRLEERFRVMGSLRDLDRAIAIWVRLVEGISQEDAESMRPMWLSNLSAGLLRRCEQSDQDSSKDLEFSIKLSRDVLGCIGDKEPKRLDFLCTLAHSLARRAIEIDSTKEMDEAIELLKEARGLVPDAPHIATEVSFNLSLRLFQRCQMGSSLEEERDSLSEDAISIAISTLDSLPKEHLMTPDLQALIGLCLFYSRIPESPSGRDQLAERMLVYLYNALNNPNYIPVYRRVQVGRLILRLHCQRGEWKEAHEVSLKAVSLIPKITSRSIDNADKQRLLSADDVVGFSSDAAAAALNAGADGYAALDLLEMGRGLLASSVSELRADLVQLCQRHPLLAKRFITLRDELQMSSHRQYQTNADFDALLDEIRTNPGFEDFLGPLRHDEILKVSQDGPVVVLTASQFRGVDAILVNLTRVHVLHLAEVTIEHLEVRSRDLSHPGLLQWLWDALAKPILDGLGLDQPQGSGSSVPRIWWVTTGILSKFPIHAAGYHSTSVNTVIDRAMSSYSSSIKALLRTRQRPFNSICPGNCRALLVAMAETPQRSPLPYASREVHEVENLIKAQSGSCVTITKRPQREHILQYLPDCQIFHFAGHGSEDISDPSHSALLLQDWKTNPMTVDSIYDLNLSERQCFMAYLSACETSRVTQPKFHDENIHLVSAYQLAGFRHVIGTLWSVDDFASVEMAKETYKTILQGGEDITDSSVCRGLHAASLKQRNNTRTRIIRKERQQESTQSNEYTRKVAVADSSGDDSDCEHHTEDFWIPYVHFGA